MSGDVISGRPREDWAALRELRAVVDAFSLVPGLDHPARAAALRLVSERMDAAVRRLRDVDGYPGAKSDPATVDGSGWAEYYAAVDAAERRRVQAVVGRALVAAGRGLLGQLGLDGSDGVDDRVDDVPEDPTVRSFTEASRGEQARLLDVVGELGRDGQVSHGSPVDSSGAGTPGAGGASPDAPIVASDDDSGPTVVPGPASGPLSSGDLVIAIVNALIGALTGSVR